MKLTSSKELLKTRIFSVTEDEAIEPGGFHIQRAIIQHPGSAVMMAIDEKKRILLVRQYRLPARQFLWELPAGRVDPGETPLKAARRELIEETGMRARTWKKLVSFYPSPGFLAEKMNLFVAMELTAGVAKPMEDERIEMRWFAARDIEQMIRAGKIIDGKTITGFLMWKAFGTGSIRS
jgi:ADP-ribose pyrophosphatase